MPTKDRAFKQKMRALSPEMREDLLKEERLKKRLAYWRREILKDFRELKAKE